MARRLAIIGPDDSITVPANSRIEIEIAVPSVGTFFLMALQGSIGRQSLETLASSPIRVAQFDIRRADTGRLIGLVRGEPNFLEMFGQAGGVGVIPRKGGEPIQRESDILIALRNISGAPVIVDMGLRGAFDTVPLGKAPEGAETLRSLWINARLTLPATTDIEGILSILTPSEGPFKILGLLGSVNEEPFGQATGIPVLLNDWQIQRPNAGAKEALVNGVADFLSVFGQNGAPAVPGVQEVLAENSETTMRFQNVSAGPAAEQRISVTMAGVVQGKPIKVEE